MNKKSPDNLDRSSQNLPIYKKSSNQLKQLGFTTSWNINDNKKDYNALEDPHANRYFRYQSVKNHIKSLKKSLRQLDMSQGQKKKMKKLIKQKLQDHLPAIKIAAKTYNIRQSQLTIKQDVNKSKFNKSIEKDKSISDLGIPKIRRNKKAKQKFSLQKRTDQQQSTLNDQVKQNQATQKTQNLKTQVRQLKEYSQTKKKSKTQNKDKQRNHYLLKQHELIHKKKHQDFISFIAKKKELLQSSQA